MGNIWWLVLDFALVAVVIYTGYRCGRRGFVKSILDIILSIVVFVLSIFLSMQLSAPIYNKFVEQKVVTSIESNINESQSANTIEEIQKSIDGAGKYIKNVLASHGTTANQVEPDIKNEIENSNVKTSQAIADHVFKPICISLIRTIIFIVLSLILMAVAKAISTALNRLVSGLVLVGTLNSVLGVILGIVKGLLYCIVLVSIISLISPLVSPDVPIIGSNTTSNTQFYMFIYEHNPINNLLNTLATKL